MGRAAGDSGRPLLAETRAGSNRRGEGQRAVGPDRSPARLVRLRGDVALVPPKVEVRRSARTSVRLDVPLSNAADAQRGGESARRRRLTGSDASAAAGAAYAGRTSRPRARSRLRTRSRQPRSI